MTDHIWDDNGVCQIHGGWCSMAPTWPELDDYQTWMRLHAPTDDEPDFGPTLQELAGE